MCLLRGRFLAYKATAQCGLPLGFVCLDVGLLVRRQSASVRSCDRPTRQRFPSVFKHNAQFLPTLHVSDAALRKLIQTFRPNAALPKLSKSRHNPAFKTQNFLTFSQQSTSYCPTFFISHCSTLPPAYLYQKDERGRIRNLHSSKFSVLVCTASH